MPTNRTIDIRGKRLITTAFMLALAAGVAGCATDKLTTGSIGRTSGKPLETMSAGELHNATAALGQSYARNPNDKRIATNFAAALQMDGDADQSLAVMRKLAIAYPKDRDVLAAYGKALAANGQFEAALDAVRRAQTPEYPDWRLVSAEAAILDQLNQKDDARQLYRKALELKPNEPSVLSNLGMSYVLEGDLRTAETYMRSAAQQPNADSRVRQNLALVVGLQGRFDEAEKIASQELSPEQAQANVAYLRQMLAQQNAWSQLKDQDKAKPPKTATN
ncbi:MULTISPECIES: tetratricopeptide repeat protein [unclassified Mesorhizobium]|uniref:tetratricopeptide repeat protein n=2 Tax=Mesorhizobium TaxID=68287 RepID=UPI000FD28719|nr:MULTISPECIES: tetratricopeptide repeat protein [unclassified Mesorhizobium]RUX02207.1 tetratricopeptide repeat protein [Mesorhizobium sp. M8A.F.Ca.ET.023.01.1.1]RWC73698.1 MAG: tetratricopeptide repeat protein [Mesorhizobium sp.]TGQ02332.1 tetratricopeptide repeat protein [Mesorhizobium sp. M8A.F.Ca.ET.218.01.1.1]TGT21602.1 tetratricopeptide repeat protein [Mesorhizobium sp. M8A.F.Ca.ET.213.01.1.1]TGT38600.1 tetratricopeptide repeat protein [Mesorhizobium sp. M8A.F.Ca.ET.165.01.1.1]